MIKKMKIVSLFIALFYSALLYADFVDIEKELYEPMEEMQKQDEAMNRAIEQRRQENQAFITEQQSIEAEQPMLEFILEGNEYLLRKPIEDINHTKVEVNLIGEMLHITTTTTTIKKIITQEGMQSHSFEKSEEESLSIPYDADATTLEHHYVDGELRVTLQKSQR